MASLELRRRSIIYSPRPPTDASSSSGWLFEISRAVKNILKKHSKRVNYIVLNHGVRLFVLIYDLWFNCSMKSQDGLWGRTFPSPRGVLLHGAHGWDRECRPELPLRLDLGKKRLWHQINENFEFLNSLLIQEFSQIVPKVIISQMLGFLNWQNCRPGCKNKKKRVFLFQNRICKKSKTEFKKGKTHGIQTENNLIRYSTHFGHRSITNWITMRQDAPVYREETNKTREKETKRWGRR